MFFKIIKDFFIKKILINTHISKINIESLMGNSNFRKQFENLDECFEASARSVRQREQFKRERFKQKYQEKHGKKKGESDSSFWSRSEVQSAFAENNRSSCSSSSGNGGCDND